MLRSHKSKQVKYSVSLLTGQGYTGYTVYFQWKKEMNLIFLKQKSKLRQDSNRLKSDKISKVLRP